MFEHFTFSALPQSRPQEDFPSPTDTSYLPLHIPASYPFLQNAYNSQLSEQALIERSRDALVKQFAAWQIDHDPGFEVDDSDTSDMSLFPPPTPIPSNTNIGTSPTCRRLQRQLNVQLQTCSSHMNDISSLVEDMITTNSQCTVQLAPKEMSRPSSRERMEKLVVDTRIEFDVEDEGYCDAEEDDLEMSLRRASTPNGIRKYGGVRYGRCADVINVGGKLKVRSLPRMRKRKQVVKRD